MTKILFALPILAALGANVAHAAAAAPTHDVATRATSALQVGYFTYNPTCVVVPIFDNFGLIVGSRVVCG